GLSYSSVTSNINLNITQIDNPPVNNIPGAQNFNQNTNLTFSAANNNAITISDVDIEGGNLTVSLQVDHGSLFLSGMNGLKVTGNNTSLLTLFGNIANINAALDGMIFTPSINYAGIITLQITSNDNNNTGSGTTSTINTITITANLHILPPQFNNTINTATNTYLEKANPIFINNSSQFTLSDTQLNLLNNGLGDYKGSALTIMRTGGTLNTQDIFSFADLSSYGITLSGNNLVYNGHVIATINNIPGKLQINFTGDSTQITDNSLVNQILESIQYKNISVNAASSVALTYTFDDGLKAVQSVVNYSINLNITSVNDAPINSFPANPSVNENNTLAFSGSNKISISDVDYNSGNETVMLQVVNGTLNLSSITNLTVIGNNSNLITITGTLTDLNNALSTLSFIPAVNFYGIATLTMTTQDLGNSGILGGSLTTINTFNITVNQYNNPSVFSNAVSVSPNTYTELGAAVAINNSNFTVTDVELNLLVSGGDYSKSVLTITRSGGVNPQDVFSFADLTGFGLLIDNVNNNITYA
ncbi:MAG: hypothetical protein ACR2HS_01510, partial [Gammaproteobacteria bacterium]